MSASQHAGIRDALLGTTSSPAAAGTASPTAKPKPVHPPTTLTPPAAQETDVWYGGYAGRTMSVGFLLCLGLSASAGWLLFRFWPQIRPEGREAWLTGVIGVLAAVWLFQLFRWAYRKTAIHIHLTTRRLFYDRGFLYGDRRAVDLRHVGQVQVRRNPWERCLKVGRVFVFGEQKEQAPLILEGIARPVAVAELIRAHALKAREGQVVAVRVVSRGSD